jgi:hypothetical protein
MSNNDRSGIKYAISRRAEDKGQVTSLVATLGGDIRQYCDGDEIYTRLKFELSHNWRDSKERLRRTVEGRMDIAVWANGDMSLHSNVVIDGNATLKMKDGEVFIERKPDYDVDYVASKLMELIKEDFSK